MPSIELSTEINAAPEAVWELMCDTSSYPEWVVPTDRMLDTGEGEMRVGFVYREYGGIPPFKGESTWEVTEFEPQSRMVHVGDDGAMTINLRIEVAPTDSGARLTQRLDFKSRWWMTPISMIMWPLLMGRRGRAAIDQTQANVKERLEAAQD